MVTSVNKWNLIVKCYLINIFFTFMYFFILFYFMHLADAFGSHHTTLIIILIIIINTINRKKRAIYIKGQILFWKIFAPSFQDIATQKSFDVRHLLKCT